MVEWLLKKYLLCNCNKDVAVFDKFGDLTQWITGNLNIQGTCGAEITVITSYLLILQFALWHSLSAKAFSELLQLIAVHLPNGANLPHSVHNLKFFSKLFPDVQATVHGYCSVCHKLLPSALSVCEDCSTGQINRFITVPLEPQLKRFFEGN